MAHNIPKPTIMADQQGTITSINPEFSEAFGWLATDLVGKSLTTIIPSNMHDAHNLGFSRFMLTKIPTLLDKEIKLNIITKDGRSLEATHVISALENDGQWTFVATITPH